MSHSWFGFPHVEFPGDHVGNQPGAVFLHEFDLAAGADLWLASMSIVALPD